MSQPPEDEAPLTPRRDYRSDRGATPRSEREARPSPREGAVVEDELHDDATDEHDAYEHDAHHMDEDYQDYEDQFDPDPDHLAHPEDLLEASDDELAEHDHETHRSRRSPLIRWGAIVGALAVVALGGYFAVQVVIGLLPAFGGGGDDVSDYEGPGNAEISIEVPEGAGGGKIAQILTDNDVVASVSAFTAAAAVDDRAVSIQPGQYRMLKQMSAQGALDRMLDPQFREVTGVTVREGLWKAEVFDLLAKETGHEVADYESVDPAALDLPNAAGGEVEGYLFPDTYSFGPDDTPTSQLQEMVTLGKKKYADLGLSGEDLRRAITEGSLIQAEGSFSDDLPKIARVIDNRLAADQPLGFDSTVHFIFQERGRAGTTDKQRASTSPYNTYKVVGLPPGPINSPGVKAIEAAMNPAKGPWLYFVTTNPNTGETKFAVTFKAHQENVAEFQKWCSNNPDDC